MTRAVIDSGSLAQKIAELAQEPPRFRVAQVTAISDDGSVTINAGGGDQPITRLVGGPVNVGDNILVVRDGNLAVCLGPLAVKSRPVSGTVAAVPGNSWTIVVNTTLGPVSALFPAAYTPTVGDDVLLVWQGSVAVAWHRGQTGSPSGTFTTSGEFASRPPSAPSDSPGDAPAGTALSPITHLTAPTSGTNTFPAVDSGTRQNGAWRSDVNGRVLAGSTPANTGAWFTGNRPLATLDGVTVTDAQVWLGRDIGGDPGPQLVHLYRVTDPTRPDADLAFTADTVDLTLDEGDQGWYEIPLELGQALVDSGGSLAVQAPDGPYVRLFGLPQSGMAGALKLAWRTA